MKAWLKALIKPEWGKIAYEKWEWIVMRAIFALWIVPPSIELASPFHAQPRPVGIAHFMDVTWISSEALHPYLVGIFWIAVALYVIGFLPMLATTILFVLHMVAGTLGNSHGATHHTVQIVGFALLGQVLAHLYFKFSQLRKKESLLVKTPHGPLIYCTTQLVAAAYVVAGLSKMLRSRGSWLKDSENLTVQMEKGIRKNFYDTHSEQGNDAIHWFVRFMDESPLIAKAMLGSGLILELFAFLALINRWTLAIFGIGLWLMHESISAAMGLGFAFNKLVLLVFLINVPYWLVAAWRLKTKRGLEKVAG